MKKWLLLAGALLGAAILARLPHPAQNVARLEPVAVVWLHMEGDFLAVETDTGAKGLGSTLTEAAEDLKARASGEIFLDTAEFLILDPRVPIANDCFALLSPDCKVIYTTAAPDLKQAAPYLTNHLPQLTLSRLRAMPST